MDLLDFPPEIFRHVINCLVSDVGVLCAWKLRSVCRKTLIPVVAQMLRADNFIGTFDQEISANILAVQPGEAFRSYRAWCLLNRKENMMYYLAYHVKSPRDVLPELPAKIQNMVEYVTKELTAIDSLDDRNILLEVCAGVAQTCPLLATFLWRNSSTSPGSEQRYRERRQALSKDITYHDQLIAAISVGAHDAVAKLLPHAPTSLSLGIFEEPILAAVRQQDHKMIAVMMTVLDQHKLKRLKKNQVIGFGSPYSMLGSMQPAIADDNVDMVKLLLGYIRRYLTLPDKTYYRQWIDRAILSRSNSVLRTLLQAAPDTKPFQINTTIFERGVKTGDSAIVTTLINYGSIQLDSSSAQMSALAASIRAGGVAVIRAVVEAGADINLVITTHRLKHCDAITPLEYAIYLNHFDAVCYLIKCGASVPATYTWHLSKKMQAVLQNAAVSQKQSTKQKH
ncbi:uncharacterized protein J4E92_001694 [Alternaria infectoria]|uniref:uncharacterized protein n=1 Tax=Alternaria infectoria TaxID=45303 RepID=UPI002220D8CA|nr:uncharacterized protein J4E92_001694 [Alternaria infectoria]KAI4936969.1 hypothetical protein J4E92_001694 [Alternaria infectoria]